MVVYFFLRNWGQIPLNFKYVIFREQFFMNTP
jgi:hypothetical protein